MTVTLTGYIDVAHDRLDAVRAALPEHIRLTRAEPGCVFFEVTEVPGHPGRFNVHEVFCDQAAFDAHQARTGASRWAEVTRGIKRNYQIRQG